MKKYKTLNEFEEESHPWLPFIPFNADKLILGTFPTIKKNRGSFDFFYPNPNNDFWKIIFDIAQENLNSNSDECQIEIRKRVLNELRLGIGDIGKKILRQKESSKDDNLFPIEYTDVFSLLESHPQIKKIILTSSSGCNSSLSWFTHYCALNGIKISVSKKTLPLKTKLSLNGREIQIDIISSTSRLSPLKGDKLFDMYHNTILD